MGYNYNKEPKYAVIDEKGNILDTFRLKSTAFQMRTKLKMTRLQKLEIVSLNNIKNINI